MRIEIAVRTFLHAPRDVDVKRKRRALCKAAALGILRAGGARNPHVLTCTLRFLRSGGEQPAIARDTFQSARPSTKRLRRIANACPRWLKRFFRVGSSSAALSPLPSSGRKIGS